MRPSTRGFAGLVARLTAAVGRLRGVVASAPGAVVHFPGVVAGVPAVLAIVLLPTCSAAAAADEAALWEALRTGGHVALLRHALAPGTGDPADFTLDDCDTQRNLSNEGRLQAKRVGDRLRANGIEDVRVLSSQWCRCLETAELLGFGTVEWLAALNSFFRDYSHREPRTKALRAWLAREGSMLDSPAVLVSHQVNITALTGVQPASATLVVVRPTLDGEIEVLGTISTE
jgi:phosphohistidine phosphatase SixA